MTPALLIGADDEIVACVLVKPAAQVVDFLDQLFALTTERTLGGWRVFRRL